MGHEEGGLDPRVWGSGTWGFIHGWAWKAKERLSRHEVEMYANTLGFVGQTLPCSDCRKHFAEMFLRMPLRYPEVDSKMSLFRWTYDAHKKVNERLGLPTPPFEEAVAFYQKLEDDVKLGKGCGTGQGCRVSQPPPATEKGSQQPQPQQSDDVAPEASSTSAGDHHGAGQKCAGGSSSAQLPGFVALILVGFLVVGAAAIAVGVSVGIRSSSGKGAGGRQQLKRR